MNHRIKFLLLLVIVLLPMVFCMVACNLTDPDDPIIEQNQFLMDADRCTKAREEATGKTLDGSLLGGGE